MMHCRVDSKDGTVITCAVTSFRPAFPWIALILPFGLRLQVAQPFFEFFSSHYNIVTWESRLILSPPDVLSTPEQFSVKHHVNDIRAVLDALNVQSANFVGYCSGAGLALASANRIPQFVQRLILVHGDYALLKYPECQTPSTLEIDTLLSKAAADRDYSLAVFTKIGQERPNFANTRPDGLDTPFENISYFCRYARNYVSYKSVDFEHLARFVSPRTFLMCGKRDAQASIASTMRIHSLISGSRAHIDAAADHYGILRADSNTLVTIWNHLTDE